MLSKSAMNGGVSTFAHLTHHQRRWVLLGMLGLRAVGKDAARPLADA